MQQQPVVVQIAERASVVECNLKYNLVVAVAENGAAYTWGVGVNGIPQTSRPTLAPGIRGAYLATAGFTNVYVAAEGDVYAWGDGSYGANGQGNGNSLGTPTLVSGLPVLKVVSMAGVGRSCFVVFENGELWGWGQNQYNVMARTGSDAYTAEYTAERIAVGAPVAQVVGSEYSVYALLADGTTVAGGNNDDGRLGIGTSGGVITNPTPVALPAGATTALIARLRQAYAVVDGSVYSWGYNSGAVLGDPTATGNRLAPAPLNPPLSGIAALASGDDSAYALTTDGVIVSWGTNHEYALGNGSANGAQVPTPLPVKGILDGRTVTRMSRQAGNNSMYAMV
ncbi:hypothetical protein O159_20850 [Leifsonia xyli subsp. cynodontis DSM 46306]|uniref:Uncharacterized protein n=1 Tax=Leifsonia xyli subsp. cynodontis DSM 46306 TaxID=1389489 RepID=U3PBE9_LEIXC|nr:hypothetical protein [Leifsonia xyli]AGW42067.1 hypothetical protein O159_20850 [Leifsonia xyli subsp. cynodontis DSM 46306]